jgi:hypothetical protein
MAFVGDYVYLPYHHVDATGGLPLEYGRFLPRDDWTLGTVCRMLDFRPRDWSGNVIAPYVDEEMPKFLQHLRETHVEMWESLIAERPALDVEPDHIGRTAVLKTLNKPIEWLTDGHHGGYRVRWRWDGERVHTTSADAYHSTWGKLKLESLMVSGVPAGDTTVKVQDNAWVNDSTIFVD